MRVAITGSHGLIGSALSESLREDGHEPVPVPRSESGIDVSVLSGCDAVVNLAGAGIGDRRWTPERKRLVLESRTSTTSRVAGALAEMGDSERPRVLLSGSAVGFYGDRGDEVLDETSAPGRLYLSDLCRQWEEATVPASAAGVRVALLRTGIVLAGRGGALGRMLPMFKLGLGGRIGSGRQWWSWLSLADEVGAIRYLLSHELSGPVNLSGPEPVTNRELTKSLGRVLRRPTFVPVPPFAPGILIGREATREVLLASQRVLPRVLLESGFQFEHRSAESALRAVL